MHDVRRVKKSTVIVSIFNLRVMHIVFIHNTETCFLFSLTSLSSLFHSYRDEPIGRWAPFTPGKPPDTSASSTWLVSHVASAGLEPTPVTAVR